MSLNSPMEHPKSEALEALAAGDLRAAEAGLLREHLALCAQCRREAERWENLFRELEELSLPPVALRSEAFATAVLSQLALAPAPETRHLTLEGVDLYLAGQLEPALLARVKSHLRGCPRCRREVDRLGALVRGLEALPPQLPSPQLRKEVLRQLPTIVAGWDPKTAPGWASALAPWLPSSPRGWAISGALALTPTLGVTAILLGIMGHPLLSVGGLLTFLRWKLSDALGQLALFLSDLVTQTPVAHWIWRGALALAEIPPATLGLWFLVLALLGALTSASALLLLRTLLSPPIREDFHAHQRS
jgi:anti-sigma factor ChrR (cupin superfamily)